jgi:hypothetical protein
MDAVQDVLPRVVAELFRKGPLSQAKLEAAWRISVGDALSRVTTVCLQPGGSVEVRPADQRWHGELKRSSSVILGRLNGLLGAAAVTRLSVVGGPVSEHRKVRGRANPPRP